MGLDITVGKTYKIGEIWQICRVLYKDTCKTTKFLLYFQDLKNGNWDSFCRKGEKQKTKTKKHNQKKKKSHVAIRIVKIKRKECGIKGDTPLMEAGRERETKEKYIISLVPGWSKVLVPSETRRSS